MRLKGDIILKKNGHNLVLGEASYALQHSKMEVKKRKFDTFFDTATITEKRTIRPPENIVRFLDLISIARAKRWFQKFCSSNLHVGGEVEIIPGIGMRSVTSLARNWRLAREPFAVNEIKISAIDMEKLRERCFSIV